MNSGRAIAAMWPEENTFVHAVTCAVLAENRAAIREIEALRDDPEKAQRREILWHQTVYKILENALRAHGEHLDAMQKQVADLMALIPGPVTIYKP